MDKLHRGSSEELVRFAELLQAVVHRMSSATVGWVACDDCYVVALPIATDHLSLRQSTEDDFDDFHALFAEPEVARYLFCELVKGEWANSLIYAVSAAGTANTARPELTPAVENMSSDRTR